MRVVLAGLVHESNTFNPRSTTYEDFAAGRLRCGVDLVKDLSGTDTEVGGFLTGQFEAVPAYLAWGWPKGPLTRECFDRCLDELLTAIDGCRPFDGVLLAIHGAMVAEGALDADAVILDRVRALIGDVPLIVTFDLHANLHPRMAHTADALIGYRTYPHVDLAARGREAARLMERTLAGEIHPVCALAKPPLMPHIMTMPTAAGPAAELMALADAERDDQGLLTTSVALGFGYADVPHLGLSTVAVADGDRAAAQAAADRLAQAAWDRRERFWIELPTAAEAVREAIAAPAGPVVLADIGDNLGGGTPGDGTFLLAELLAQGARDAVLVLYEPEAAAACAAAGVGQTIELAVGGKQDDFHGAPVTVSGRVKVLTDGVYRNRGPMRDGLVDNQGLTAVLALEIGELMLTSQRMPTWNLEQMRHCGIEPTRRKIIVSKGALAHRAAYAPIAARLIDVDTPGVTPADYRRLPFQHARRPLYRLDEEVVWGD